MSRCPVMTRTKVTDRRGVALLLTMLLLVLLVTIAGELATLTTTQSVIQARSGHTLQHELAVESLVRVLPACLEGSGAAPSPLVRDLDADGVASLELNLGECEVRCVVDDDGGKFSPVLFQRDDQRDSLERKLKLLAWHTGLSSSYVHLRPLMTPHGDAVGHGERRYRTFDQLIDASGAVEIFHLAGAPATTWSDVLTLWGDGRIDLRRAPEAVLESALEDLRPGLGRELLARRPPDRSSDFREAALARIDAELRPAVAARITFGGRRYALDVDTAIGADRRRWYLVVEAGEESVHVLHRSAVTW